MSAPAAAPLLTTPLNALHIELGARMVPFAGYSMPVQYPAGLMAEHLHTRQAAGLFDVSHMGQLRLVGPDAAAAFESLMPVDVIDLPVGKQRYGLLLNDAGGIIDDLMFFRVAQDEIFVIVNGACKEGDIAHIQARIGQRCQVIPLPDQALLALQGPQAATALARLAPGVEKLVFMTGGNFQIAGCECFVTRSGYTGEDGFEISAPAAQADTLARALLAQLDNPASLTRKRVGLVALERVPVREHTKLQTTEGQKIGEVTSGLLGPSFDKPIALAYVDPQHAAVGTRVNAIVRGKAVPMEVCATPFVPTRYYRG